MSKKKRKIYPKEFKHEAVRLVLEKGMSGADVARDLGVPVARIYAWKREFMKDPAFSFPGHGNVAGDDAELRSLQRRVKVLEEERDILKKTLGYFVSDDK